MERIVDLIQTTGDGAVAIDRRQRIVFCNKAFEKLLGYQASEVINRPCYDVIGGTKVDGCMVCQRDCALFKAGRKHQPVSAREIFTKTKDGTDIWLSVSTLSVPSTWSELSVLVHLLTDITDRKQLEFSVGRLLEDYTKQIAGESKTPASATLPDINGQLSSREIEVLQVLATGTTTNEIATRLSISTATVRNHVHHIISKLGVHSRLEAVTLALRTGLI